MHLILAALIPHAVAAMGGNFQLLFQLRVCLGMDGQTAFSTHDAEGIAEIFHSDNTAHLGLLAVHLQVKMLLDKGRDGLADTMGGSLALTEDYAVVCVADEAQSSPFEFLV